MSPRSFVKQLKPILLHPFFRLQNFPLHPPLPLKLNASIKKSLPSSTLKYRTWIWSILPAQVAAKAFPKDFHFFAEHLLKTQLFYQFILVDTELIENFHVQDKNQPIKRAFSNCNILEVLSLSDEIIYVSYKNLSQAFTPPMYNYHDHMLAWDNTFCNRNFDHSWFNIFGPIPDILPDWVQDGFHLFSSFQEDFPSNPFSSSLFKFFISHSISWIMCWDYVFINVSLWLAKSK